ncbi:MAG: hypothetical protein ACOYOQ_16565, partial [Microthrixaceae bacterium]
MRYWLYKNNFVDGGPAGYWGHWRCTFFSDPGPSEWGGSKAFRSPEVHRYLNDEIQPGDVVVAYQTDTQQVVGFATVVSIDGSPGDRELVLQPIHLLDEPFLIHKHKKGTCLEHDTAVNGRVGIRELEARQMKELVRLSGAPVDVLHGNAGPGGWIPGSPCVSAFEVYDFDSGRGVEVEVRWWEDPPTFVVR